MNSISICSNWSERTGTASIHRAEVEIMHLISVAYGDTDLVCSETLIDKAKTTPSIYPALTSMEPREAVWHVTSTLKRLNYTRQNKNSKYWMRG